ncbi:hypothetical protein Q5752_004426 [Cryptotrichosporon argae]
MAAATSPPLRRPKSKLRLRLGLTPPHPATPPRPVLPVAPAAAAALEATMTRDQAHAPRYVPINPSMPSPTAQYASGTLQVPFRSPAHTQLDSSTSTGADSHTAFTFDSHSSPSNRNTLSPGFECVSYASSSPSSVLGDEPKLDAAYDMSSDSIDDNGFANALVNPRLDRSAYPTPSSSPSFIDALHAQEAAQEAAMSAPAPYHHIQAAADTCSDIYSLTDEQLVDRFELEYECGLGNWGCVWKVRPRSATKETRSAQYNSLGRAAAGAGGGRVAFKIIARDRTQTTAARVRALWGEMKIIRTLKHEPHPSIIQFEAFIITPNYAIVLMPYLPQVIPLKLEYARAKPYLRQLASAVGYLHERGITHNDIKPTNVLLSYNDVPVLVDFGFAQRWDMAARSPFLSTICWGTSEYLDPQRARGMPHDERHSDVWALGITMYEILIGRTPFEATEDEVFETPEQLRVYHDRTRRGHWWGPWSMPDVMRHLIKSMVNPNPVDRLTAIQAYHHPALAAETPNVIVTPHFVRAAVEEGEFESAAEAVPVPPLPSHLGRHSHSHDTAEQAAPAKTHRAGDAKKRRKRPSGETRGRPVTPALGESIKQHTSAAKPKALVPKGDVVTSGVAGVENPASPARERYVIKKTRDEAELRPRSRGVREDDDTPTKMTKPAQPLRLKENARQIQPRVSESDVRKLARTTSSRSLKTISRPASSNSLRRDKAERTAAARASSALERDSVTAQRSAARESATVRDSSASHAANRDSVQSAMSAQSVPAPRTKDEAVLRTMRSLEGGSRTNLRRDFLAYVKRAAPAAPAPDASHRPVSLDSAASSQTKDKRIEHGPCQRLDRVAVPLELVEEERSPAKPSTSTSSTSTATSTHTASTETAATTDTERADPADRRPVSLPLPAIVSRRSPRRATRAVGSKPPVVDTVIDTTEPFPHSLAMAAGAYSPGEDVPLAGLRERIVAEDEKRATRFRSVSGTLVDPPSPARRAKQSTAPEAIPQHGSAGGVDSQLDRLAEWVKDVERMIEQARRLNAEGHPVVVPHMPIPADLEGLCDLPALPGLASADGDATPVQKTFGVSPDKALPAHLRTASTQVEPATPPKWMTYAEAEAHVRQAELERLVRRDSAVLAGKAATSPIESTFSTLDAPRMVPIKKERPTVSHVLKLFGADKDKEPGSRSATPDPTLSRQKLLRGTPSTPALRANTTHRVPARKSESNLRNFNTAPTHKSPLARSASGAGVYDDDDDDDDDDEGGAAAGFPRGIYEQLLDTTPGVSRHGDGWASTVFLPPPPPPAARARHMAKPSSMASLRDRALAFLGDKRADDDAATLTDALGLGPGPAPAPTLVGKERRNSKASTLMFLPPGRPGTPSAASVLNPPASAKDVGKVKGLFKRLGGIGKKGRLDKLDEAEA